MLPSSGLSICRMVVCQRMSLYVHAGMDTYKAERAELTVLKLAAGCFWLTKTVPRGQLARGSAKDVLGA